MLSFSQPPIHIIRPGHVEGQPIVEGAPYLQVSTTGFFPGSIMTGVREHTWT